MQIFFKILDRKFQLKNSKGFPHRINKSWCIDGGTNACGNSNELLRRKVYRSGYWISIIGHTPMMCNGNL